MACEALSFKASAPHVGWHRTSSPSSTNKQSPSEVIRAKAALKLARAGQGNAGTKGCSFCCFNGHEHLGTRRRVGVKGDRGLGQIPPQNSQGGYSHTRKTPSPQAATGSPGAPRRGQLDSPNTLPEVEIITRDGVIRRNVRQSRVEKQSEEEKEAAAEESFKSSASLAEGFARQQQEAARAQVGGERLQAESSQKERSIGGSESVDDAEVLDPVKARTAAMKKKALEYKAAKEAAGMEGSKQVASIKGTKNSGGAVSEGSSQGSESEEHKEVDPIKARLEAMKKKALDYKSSKLSPGSPTLVSDPEPPVLDELPQELPGTSEGGIGPELALLMSQRRRTEPSAYANVIKPLERPSEEDMPEIEILVGNEGAVNGPPSKRVLEENEDAYKPKVATWGVFPRPQNISQAYGGGRTLRPGEPLISEEEKAAANKKTMDLINAYKKKVGIEMDPGVEEKAERALASGERLMNRGALRESVVYFDQVIQDTPFRSEVHGQALLHKAVVWDSLADSEAAKPLYEKLSQHPKGHIQKKAAQMLFGFAAADKLKFSKSTIKFHDPSVYQRYLERFSNGYNNTYTPSAEELEQSAKDAGKSQVFAIAMVAAPLLLIGALIASKGLV